MKQFRKFAVGAISACVVAMTPMASNAATIQLGFVLDGSSSITPSEWSIISTGLGNAINLIPFGGDDTYEVSVVQFATNAMTYANASRIVISNATVRGNLATFVAGLTQDRSFTNYEAGFAAMQSVLAPSISTAAFSYVNFATDGAPNTCGTAGNSTNGNAGSLAAAQACAVNGRNALLASGVDNISIEGIGVSFSNASFLQNSICSPQSCDTTSPFNFPTQGFYIGVANATEYAAAIQNKVRVVTGQVPEPTSIALVGLALLGLGAARRRKA